MPGDGHDDVDDLVQLVRQLRLDHLALVVSRRLAAADVPHALVKGPTTSLWLYNPPREYRDVDVLVPPSRLDDATRALTRAGVVRDGHAAPGELAAHSLVLTATDGAEVDLHVALPGMPAPTDDLLWESLRSHVVPFELSGHPLPALDEVGRCLVLALHAVMAGPHDSRPWEDLRRSREVTAREVWDDVTRLALAVGLDRHVRAAIAHIEGRSVTVTTPEIRLLMSGASGSAVQLERLSHLPVRRRIRLLARELFPSRAFVSGRFPDLAGQPAGYLRGWWRRSKSLVGGLSGALGELREARKNAG